MFVLILFQLKQKDIHLFYEYVKLLDTLHIFINMLK